MSLKEPASIKAIIAAYESHKGALAHNHALIDAFEGNLLCYVETDLRQQLSPQSYEQCKHRIPPINLLTKLIDKMSTLYSQPPTRRIAGGTESDQVLLDWYLERLDVDGEMSKSLELFNMTKAQTVQAFVDNDGAPKLRSVPTDSFFVLGLDPVEPTKVTHLVTFDAHGEDVTFYAYTAKEFVVFNGKGEVLSDYMEALGNPEGVNPFGVLPFTYQANARFSATPTIDTDLFRMIKLIPILLADLNFAVMFQAFCIIYGIDVNDENLKYSPNAFWRFKSDPESDKKPSVGVLKPQVDIGDVLGLIQSELALWLNSKGIRPGAIGDLKADQFASGVSKLIDEMDTVELRRKLVKIFTRIETEFWTKLMHKLHPVWVDSKKLAGQTAKFSASAKIEVVFTPQLPSTARGQVVAEQKAELDAGFTTRTRCLQEINPGMSAKEIEDLETEIDEEQGAVKPAEGDGTTDPTAPPASTEVDVQKQALNGAQVEALLSITERVAIGKLAKPSAKAIILQAFPAMDQAAVDAIIDPIVVTGEPEPPKSPPPFGGGNPPPKAEPDPEEEPESSGAA